MTTIAFDTPGQYAQALVAGTVGGLVPITVAAAILGVNRTRLMTKAKDGALTLIEIGHAEKTVRGVTPESLTALAKARREKHERLEAVTPETLRRQIETGLLANGFAENGKCLEYGAGIMKPLGLDHRRTQDRERIGTALEALSEVSWNDPDCAALLSAVVVNKSGKNKGRPSESFWDLAEKTTGRKLRTKSRREAFWKEQIAQLQLYIGKLA
jgi:hypothetical protein